MDYDKKFDNLQPGTTVTASYTEGRHVFKGVVSSVNREHPDKPPYFVKLNKEHPEKSLWFYPWEILSAEIKDPQLRLNIRAPRTMEEQELMRRAGRECAGVNRYGHPVDRNGEEILVAFDNMPEEMFRAADPPPRIPPPRIRRVVAPRNEPVDPVENMWGVPAPEENAQQIADIYGQLVPVQNPVPPEAAVPNDDFDDDDDPAGDEEDEEYDPR